jgi:hypothetical protein
MESLAPSTGLTELLARKGENAKRREGSLSAFAGNWSGRYFRGKSESSPRRTQLEPGFIERGTLRLKRLRRAAVMEVIPWNGSSEPEPKASATPNEPRDPLKLAHYYQSLLDSRRFENRAALARYLGVSRARVTQVLRRLVGA